MKEFSTHIAIIYNSLGFLLLVVALFFSLPLILLLCIVFFPLIGFVLWYLGNKSLTLFMDGHKQHDLSIGFIGTTFGLVINLFKELNVVSFAPVYFPLGIFFIITFAIYLLMRNKLGISLQKSILPILASAFILIVYCLGIVLFINTETESGSHLFTHDFRVDNVSAISLERGGKSVIAQLENHENLHKPIEIRLNNYFESGFNEIETVTLQIRTGSLGIQTWVIADNKTN